MGGKLKPNISCLYKPPEELQQALAQTTNLFNSKD